jgi:hypothetical protein
MDPATARRMTGSGSQDDKLKCAADRLEMPPMMGLVRAADHELGRGAPSSDVLDKRSAIQDLLCSKSRENCF